MQILEAPNEEESILILDIFRLVDLLNSFKPTY